MGEFRQDDAAGDLGPLCRNRFGDGYLPAINRGAFATEAAAVVYEHYVGDLLWEEDTLYLCAGTDSGLLLAHILTHGPPGGSRYLLVELPEVIERLQLTSSHSRVLVVTPDQFEPTLRECAISDYLYLGRVRPLRSLAALDGNHPGYAKVWDDVNRGYHIYWFNTHMSTTADRNFFLKTLENVAENRVPAGVLRRSCRGRVAVLLAGGPSLHTFLPWVKAHRERLTVLAVSRVCRVLQQEGVIPDVIGSIDPDDTFMANSKEMLGYWRDALFINMYHVHSSLLGQWRGRSVFQGPLFPWTSPANEGCSEVPPGLTVAHKLLGAAIDMGFRQVILLGLDLCFSPEGFSHTRGSLEHALGPFMGTFDLTVETNGGWQAETFYDFYLAIPSLAELAVQAAERGVELVNPAPGAAKVPGVGHRSLPGWVPPAGDGESWGGVLARVLPPDTVAHRLAHYQQVLADLERVAAQVQVVHRLAAEGWACNERFFGRHGGPPEVAAKRRMDLIEYTLDHDYQEISRLVKRWGVADFLRLTRPDREKEPSLSEVEQMGSSYYRIYQESAQGVLELLAGVRARVVARREEEGEEPDWSRLLAQWRLDRQPGRLAGVLERRGESLASLPEPLRGEGEAMMAAFASLLVSTDNAYEQFCRNQLQPWVVRAKAMELFRGRRKDRLAALVEGLQASVLEDREDFVAMIRGYMAELAGDDASARAGYQAVTSAWLWVEARLRLVTVSLRLGEAATALDILEQLQEKAAFCMPLLADLLRILGRAGDAIAVYRRYLDAVDLDLVVAFRLGELLRDEGRCEEARELFQRVLEHHPGHESARSFLAELG